MRAEPGGRRPMWVALVVIALVVVVTGGLLVATRDDGTSTPESAVARFTDALAAGDLADLVDGLPPGERVALLDGLGGLGGAVDAGVLADVDLSAVPGLSVRFEDVEQRTTDLAGGTVAVDLVGGRVRGQVDLGSAVTAGTAELLEAAGLAVGSHGEVDRDLAEDPLRLVVLREGGWHVSLGYTVAEQARLARDLPVPRFGEGPDAIGADTPAAVVLDLAQAWADDDVARSVSLLSPAEARTVYDYAPVFVPDATRDGRRAGDAGRSDTQLNSIEVTAAGAGPVQRVTVTGLDVDIRDRALRTHVVIDDGCTTVDHRFLDGPVVAEARVCADGAALTPEQRGAAGDPLALLAVADGGAGLPTFTVIERNGRWFLSPVRTALGAIAVEVTRDPSGSRLAGAALGRAWTSLVDPTGGAGAVDRFGPDEPERWCDAVVERLAPSSVVGVDELRSRCLAASAPPVEPASGPAG